MTGFSLAETARQIIAKVVYLTLATSSEIGEPWCTPLYAAYNDRYEFYWASGHDTRHSVNIRENPHVSATIYDSSVEEGTGGAVYMEGFAKELTAATWQDGLFLLRHRSRLADKFYPVDEYFTDGPLRLYHFIPREFSMLNSGGDPRYETYADCRVKINIFDDD
jgi:hypothetical protein